jgi:hypothetical protein
LVADFVYKRLVNGRGYYAAIELSIAEVEKPGFGLEYNSLFNSNENWYEPIYRAVKYFYEHYYPNEKGLFIKVLDLHTMIVDSTPAVVSYVSLMALCKAYQIDPVGIEFSNQYGFSVK